MSDRAEEFKAFKQSFEFQELADTQDDQSEECVYSFKQIASSSQKDSTDPNEESFKSMFEGRLSNIKERIICRSLLYFSTYQ